MTQTEKKIDLSWLDRRKRIQLAAEAIVDERTVVAVYEGRRVQSLSRARVEGAARRLGFAMPAPWSPWRYPMPRRKR